MKRIPLAAAAMLILAACGGATASPTATPVSSPTTIPSTAAQPPANPSSSPPLVSVAPVVPASSPPASPAPPVGPAGPLSPSLTITTADEGKTFHVKIGAVIDVSMKADSGMQPWAVQNPDMTILQAIPNPAAAAAQGVTLRSFKAIAAGTATLMASDRPQCSPGQACPQFIRAWKVTVIVDPS